MAGCGGDDGTGPGGQLPAEIAFLEGSWTAESLELTNATGETTVDLVDLGASFTFRVSSDGSYTATLSGFGVGGTETGTLGYADGQLILNREDPPPATSERVDLRQEGTRVILEGSAEFDFDLDGRPDPADSRIVLSRS